MKFFCDFPAFCNFFGGKAAFFMGPAFLNYAGNLESAPAKYFFQGSDGACGLFENQVEGPWGSARCDDDGFLSF